MSNEIKQLELQLEERNTKLKSYYNNKELINSYHDTTTTGILPIRGYYDSYNYFKNKKSEQEYKEHLIKTTNEINYYIKELRELFLIISDVYQTFD